VSTPRGVRRVGALLLTGAGLTLALAATAGPLPPADAAPGASLVVHLPDPVRLLVLTLLALSVILLLGLQRPRRRRAGELPARDLRARSVWAALAVVLPIVLTVIALCYIVWYGNYRDGRDPLQTALATISQFLEFLAQSRKAPTSSTIFNVAIATLAVTFAAAIFLATVLLTLAERLLRRGADSTAAVRTPLEDAVAESLEDLRRETDVRRAIIVAYRRLERALSLARAGRAPWETPSEFLRTALARLPVPAPALHRLTTLFELARFSDRPLGTDARDDACDCLDEIQLALQRVTAHAS